MICPFVAANLTAKVPFFCFAFKDEKRSSDRNSVYSKEASGGDGRSGNPHIESSLPSSPAPPPRPLSTISTERNASKQQPILNGEALKSPPVSPRLSLSKTALDTLKNTLLEIGEPRQLVVTCPHCGDNKVIMARQVKKEEVETNPAFADFLQVSRTNSPVGFVRRPSTRVSQRSRTSSCRHRGTPGHKCHSNGNHGGRRSSSKSHHSSHGHAPGGSLNNLQTQQMTELSAAAKNGSNGRANSIHMMECFQQDAKPENETGFSLKERWQKFMEDRDDYSLWIFHPQHRFRIFSMTLTEKAWFDFIILIFIAANCITLAMERPNIPPWSTERQILDICNNVFTVVFTIEMAFKAVSTGLIYGENAYFKSGWNIMDGSLVIVSLFDTIISVIFGQTSKIFDILRVFRLVRALRPLRVINRAPGLKLVVQTLLSSLKPIGNIVLICCTFFIIFGILGVQLFKGIFYYCEGPDAEYVTNKTQCLELSANGNRWVNHKYNFDNLGQALMSLFVLSSKDGWVNIMYQGLDAVGIDQQPRENFNEWRLIYFISFLLLVGFFVLNMFVGVVVENFHRCRAEQEKEERARRAAKRAKKIEERRRKMLETPYYIHYSPTRMTVHKMVTSKYFDLAISAVIGLNVITMAMEFYMMPRGLAYALKVFNYFFTAVFILEAGMKIAALGCGRYLNDRWNQLDVAIVFLSVLGIVLEELKSDLMPINPTIMRVMRVLRIARVLKLLKMAKGIRALLDTVMQALPQVGNLGLLFFLLFFIFAALGVEMFGRLECDEFHPCQGLGEHAHFRSFGMAFLTLFRIATGDNWNGIMKDTLREECEDGDDCLRNCCVSPYFAPLFFVVFVLMAQFVLVNVVVAVLMKHLEESHKQLIVESASMEDDVEVELELEKQLSLAHELF